MPSYQTRDFFFFLIVNWEALFVRSLANNCASVQLFFPLEQKGLLVNEYFSQARVCIFGSAPLQDTLLTHQVPEQGESCQCQLKERLSMRMKMLVYCHRLRKLWEGACCQKVNVWAAELSWMPPPEVTCFLVLVQLRGAPGNTSIQSLHTHMYISDLRGGTSTLIFGKNTEYFLPGEKKKRSTDSTASTCSIQFMLTHYLSAGSSYLKNNKIKPPKFISAIARPDWCRKLQSRNISILKNLHIIWYFNYSAVKCLKLFDLKDLEAVAAKEGGIYKS